MCAASTRERYDVTHTGCRESRVELDISEFVLAVPRADAVVAARGEDADATRTEFCVQFAHGHCIFWREEGLIASIRNADRLRDILILKVEQVGEPHDITVARHWLVACG